MSILEILFQDDYFKKDCYLEENAIAAFRLFVFFYLINCVDRKWVPNLKIGPKWKQLAQILKIGSNS